MNKLIIYLCRRNINPKKVRKYAGLNNIIIISLFLIMFLLNFPTFIKVSFLILFSISSIISHLYLNNINIVQFKYRDRLFSCNSEKEHQQIVCAFSDEQFKNKVYNILIIDKQKYNIFKTYPTIKDNNDDDYNFNDWKVFKFTKIKKSRKIKLKKLQKLYNQ